MRKALIVGIDQCENNGNRVSSCASSAQTLSKLLSRHDGECAQEGELNFDCKTLISMHEKSATTITRAVLKENCKALFEDEEVDTAFFYFSGFWIEDPLGDYLVTEDTEQFDQGLALSDLLIFVNNSSIKEINIILDLYTTKESQKQLCIEEQYAFLRKGVSILSVKHGNCEKSNLFTELITNSLLGGNDDILGNVTFIDLFENNSAILNAFGYQVTFRSNISRLTVLRKTIRQLPYPVVVKIREYFHSQNYYYPLSNEHIPSQELGDFKKQEVYKNLQKMIKYGLVKPVNADHLYYAALKKKHCALTERGQQYWDLLEKKRI